MKCAISSTIAAILLLLFKWAITAPNVLTGSQHYIRHRRKIHPHNHAVKSIILKDFKLLQNNLGTGRIFWSDLPLISFKRDKSTSNFSSEVRSKQVINPELLNQCARTMQSISYYT